jgi:hypothetical protein
VDLEHTAIPTLECWPAKIYTVDLNSLRDNVFCQAFQKRFLGLHFIECGIDKVDAQHADGLLLEDFVCSAATREICLCNQCSGWIIEGLCRRSKQWFFDAPAEHSFRPDTIGVRQ